MGHNLNETVDANGVKRHAFMSLRENAWHGLGTVISEPVGSREAIKLALLDWTVEKQPLYRNDMSPVPSHVAIVRSDTKATLGVVGADFTPVQNHELFDWFDGLDGFSNVIFETAGALGAGETVWVLARCPDLCFDIGGDEHRGYMSLTNGHGGNRRLTLTPTNIRQVCANTTRMIDAQSRHNTLSSGWELRHTTRIKDHLALIRELYARTTKAWAHTEMLLRTLAKVPVTDDSLTRMFSEPWKKGRTIKVEVDGKRSDYSGAAVASLTAKVQEALGEDESEEETTDPDKQHFLIEQRQERLRAIFESETCAGFEATRGTMFAAFNAVTEYLEHDAPTRKPKGVTAEQAAKAAMARRFETANLDGNNAAVKARAWRLSLELAGVGG